MELGEGLIFPVHRHPAGAAPVALLCNHPYKLGLLYRGPNYHILPLLHLAPLCGNQARILFQNRFFHGKSFPAYVVVLFIILRTAGFVNSSFSDPAEKTAHSSDCPKNRRIRLKYLPSSAAIPAGRTTAPPQNDCRLFCGGAVVPMLVHNSNFQLWCLCQNIGKIRLNMPRPPRWRRGSGFPPSAFRTGPACPLAVRG